MRKIELLAPAKNLECGIAAIDHGADAVYIGPQNFGARHAAGNTISDIASLCDYAHQFNAKVYATVNTVVFDHEISNAIETVRSLKEVGIDAILLQDMGLLTALRQQAPVLADSITWHASTQTDNRTTGKVAWLKTLGFQRTVLARELTAEEIKAIPLTEPEMELEVFIHGALCVSYSGQCYASQHCFQRSANRGECAQMCRMKYSLVDGSGNTIAPEAYYLSLKDQCQIDNLEEIIHAGACSLKIEGRLKDITYVKNVVSAYSQRLNEIISRHNSEKGKGSCQESLARSSWGSVVYTFSPDLRRSFNRGYTTYFLHGRDHHMASLLTPKAIGENVGKVKEIRHGRQPSFNVAGVAAFVNGDGLCFLDRNGELQGFRVNRAEGNRLFPLAMPEGLTPGTTLYRSQDKDFDRIMQGKTAIRTIPVSMNLEDCGYHVLLRISGIDSPLYGEAILQLTNRQPAQKPQKENILRQLSKLGGTIFSASEITISPSLSSTFIPSSQLAELRRKAIEALNASHGDDHETSETLSQKDAKGKSETLSQKDGKGKSETLSQKDVKEKVAYISSPLYRKFPYLYNATNAFSRRFYNSLGTVADGLETASENSERSRETLSANDVSGQSRRVLLMQCRYCIRHALGVCTKESPAQKWRTPLYLRLSDGRRFALEFDCKNCQMNIYSE